ATLTYALVCWASSGRLGPSHYFTEGGPIDWLSSVFLAAAAVLAWCTWSVKPHERERGSWFWLASAAGFVFLALDERFMFHERFHFRFGHLLGPPPAGLRNWNDVVVIVYGLAALGLLVPAWTFLLRYRQHLRVLMLAFGFYALHTMVDSVFASSPGKTLVEESFKVLAGAGFMLAYLQALMARLDPSFPSGVAKRKPAHPGGSSPEGRSVRPSASDLGGRSLLAFSLTVGLMAIPMLLARGRWRRELTLRWGDPVYWLVSVFLGVAALLAWMAWPPLRRRMRQSHLLWQTSAALLAFLAWIGATLACRISFSRSPLAAWLRGRPGVRLPPGHLPPDLPLVMLMSLALVMVITSMRVFGKDLWRERLFGLAVLATLLLGLQLQGFLPEGGSKDSRMAVVTPILLLLASGASLLSLVQALVARSAAHLELVAACKRKFGGLASDGRGLR
ncbi:MAG: hypothetical protein ACE5ID_09975, partial [Acidobacteriota bacterium]